MKTPNSSFSRRPDNAPAARRSRRDNTSDGSSVSPAPRGKRSEASADRRSSSASSAPRFLREGSGGSRNPSSRPLGKTPAETHTVAPAPVPTFRPDPFFAEGIRRLPEALDFIMPLRHAHRADLPDAIRELSALLTTERYALARSYWSAPRFVSAYLRYFLPWNLLRLHRLFTQIPLPVSQEEPPLVLDLGSGPLSVPLALWLSKPAWRKASVRLRCADTAPRPMHIGLTLLEQLASMLGEPLRWTVRLERAPLAKALGDPHGKPNLITGGNVLNEWEGQDIADAPIADRLGDVAEAIVRTLAPSGRALFIEPGTRLGGTLTASLRAAAIEEGLTPVAPCTHSAECPLLGKRGRGWCHVHEELVPRAVPAWLADLSQKARLTKQALSFSYVLLHSSNAEAAPRGQAPEHELKARLLSDTFFVPTLGLARYACSERGLLLIPHAEGLGAGETVRCKLPATPRRDAKSGALIAVEAKKED